jgi:hypothetical protein
MALASNAVFLAEIVCQEVSEFDLLLVFAVRLPEFSFSVAVWSILINSTVA